jgi:hypothetical protein
MANFGECFIVVVVDTTNNANQSAEVQAISRLLTQKQPWRNILVKIEEKETIILVDKWYKIGF